MLAGTRALRCHAQRRELQEHFCRARGFGAVTRVVSADGVRIFFDNGDIAHLRPSGNAPQMRIYAVSDTQPRADAIVAEGVREPDGILRALAHAALVPSRP